ncbi:unnamed protein product, partial [Prorocentrum cordatum]
MRRTAATAAATVAVVAVIAGAPAGVLEPWSLAAALYVAVVFGFHDMHHEIQHPDMGVLVLLGGALAAASAPSLAQAVGIWVHGAARLAVFALDVLLVAASYLHIVRGPVPSLGAGSLRGKAYVVTGCSAGIGLETAEALVRAGATVVFACRSEDRARAAIDGIIQRASGVGLEEGQLRFLPLDLCSCGSVRRFVELLQASKLSVSALILNAGAIVGSRKLTEDGLEMTLASNHLGHFQLVRLLLPSLLAAEARGERPRIVAVGSTLCFSHDSVDLTEAVAVGDGAERSEFLARPYSTFHAYGQSKLAGALFVAELARRLRRRGSRIPVNLLHPGEIGTSIAMDIFPEWSRPLMAVLVPVLGPLWMKTPRQGSFCTLHLATSPALASAEQASGAFFLRLRRVPGPKAMADEAMARELWEV